MEREKRDILKTRHEGAIVDIKGRREILSLDSFRSRAMTLTHGGPAIMTLSMMMARPRAGVSG